jgi:hypothetical protein
MVAPVLPGREEQGLGVVPGVALRIVVAISLAKMGRATAAMVLAM